MRTNSKIERYLVERNWPLRCRYCHIVISEVVDARGHITRSALSVLREHESMEIRRAKAVLKRHGRRA